MAAPPKSSPLLGPADTIPGRGRLRRFGPPRPDRTGPSVRAGSVAHRDHRGTSGHHRSPTAKRSGWSTNLQRRQLEQRQAADQIVAPKVRLGGSGSRRAATDRLRDRHDSRRLPQPETDRPSPSVLQHEVITKEYGSSWIFRTSPDQRKRTPASPATAFLLGNWH
jgi:hypothetical protein